MACRVAWTQACAAPSHRAAQRWASSPPSFIRRVAEVARPSSQPLTNCSAQSMPRATITLTAGGAITLGKLRSSGSADVHITSGGVGASNTTIPLVLAGLLLAGTVNAQTNAPVAGAVAGATISVDTLINLWEGISNATDLEPCAAVGTDGKFQTTFAQKFNLVEVDTQLTKFKFGLVHATVWETSAAREEFGLGGSFDVFKGTNTFTTAARSISLHTVNFSDIGIFIGAVMPAEDYIQPAFNINRAKLLVGGRFKF